MPRFALLFVLLLPSFVFPADLGLKVPEDFTITEFAPAKLANDIFCLHVDSRGRVLVAGRGYVRHLIDDNNDGKADRAVDVIPSPKEGPMGLLWEDDTLYVVTDGGLWRYRGVDGLKTAMAKPELVLKLTTGGEHASHAVRRLPDGKLYVLCGNNSNITAKTVTAEDSPVKNPVAGALLRVSDDGKEVAVIADGFRNAYDFDFNLQGYMVTFDSDNERCVGLPWYEPTRVYKIVPGGNAGWLNPQHAVRWRKPPYFSDVEEPAYLAGRGSPTGVACYRHQAFPLKYLNGFFLADWTFGTIWFSPPLGRAKPRSSPEAFLTVTGDNGFAPTGLAVHPKSGELFVSIGGRGTRGAVYRVKYSKAMPDAKEQKGQMFGVRNANYPVPDRIRASELLEAKTPETQLRVLRGWQISLGDLIHPKKIGTAFEGYTLRKPADQNTSREIRKAIRHVYPTGNTDVDRELSRTLAALADETDEACEKVTSHLVSMTNPIERVHDLLVLSQLRGKLSASDTKRLAEAIVHLDAAYEKQQLARDSYWPVALSEVVAALLAQTPTLADAILEHPDFGSPSHVWLAGVSGMDSQKVARVFVAQAAKNPGYSWSGGTVRLLAALPAEEARPLLVKLAARGGLDDSVLTLLARKPEAADRVSLIRGLSSLQAGVVSACIRGLQTLPMPSDTAELVPLIKALRRFPDAKSDASVRTAVLKRLTDTTKQTFTEVVEWEKWLSTAHPDSAKLLESAGYDARKWKTKLAGVNWENGQVERGARLFESANCAACHVGGRATGPALSGVSKRFNRDDLLTAILDPNRDVSPRYRTVRIVTDDDRVYEGMIVYEATDGVLLQTSADVTVRIAGKSIVSQKPGTNSLMPTGLLDAMQPQDVADLLAYLKSLK